MIRVCLSAPFCPQLCHSSRFPCWPEIWIVPPCYSIFKFFQDDNAGMLRMTASARYFKEVVGPSRPN
jgi:hypothetical protein